MSIEFPRRRTNPSPIPAVGLRQMLAAAPARHAGLRAALEGLAGAYVKTVEARQRIVRDLTLNEAARTVRSAKTARGHLGPAMAALADARQRFEEGRASLRQKVNAPFRFDQRHVSDVMIGAEIRQHFANMPAADRAKAVRTAVENADLRTLTALGAGPAYLSGLGDGLHELARATVIGAYKDASEARDDLAALDIQSDFADKISNTVLQSAADLINFVEADSLAAMAADVDAA
jgi:hypothetical protein